MNYGMLISQIINKININSFNILEKDCKDGNPVPGATTRFSFIKSGDLMQTKKTNPKTLHNYGISLEDATDPSISNKIEKQAPVR